MMENEAGLWGVVKAGYILTLTDISQKQHSHSPPYPNALLFIQTLHVFTMYRTAMGWPVKQKAFTSMYKMYTQDQRKGGKLQLPKVGI